MDIDLNSLELEILEHLYLEAERDLSDSLLSGASWDEVYEKRFIVTKIRASLFKARQVASGASPADSMQRGPHHRTAGNQQQN
jgi:hypothetical protein